MTEAGAAIGVSVGMMSIFVGRPMDVVGLPRFAFALVVSAEVNAAR